MGVASCPMCHKTNRDTVKQCDDCGYEFGQSIDTLRDMLKTQLANARAMFWVLLAAGLALAGVVVLGVMHGFLIFSMPPFLFVTYQAIGAARKISISKHSLRLIEQKALPKATLVSG